MREGGICKGKGFGQGGCIYRCAFDETLLQLQIRSSVGSVQGSRFEAHCFQYVTPARALNSVPSSVCRFHLTLNNRVPHALAEDKGSKHSFLKSFGKFALPN